MSMPPKTTESVNLMQFMMFANHLCDRRDNEAIINSISSDAIFTFDARSVDDNAGQQQPHHL